jgi:hypothetical protein
MSTGDSFSKLIIAIVETSVPNVGQNLVGKTLEEATDVLSDRGLELLYESRTSLLNASQRKLYESILVKVPSKLAIFVDPIIISFALKDACDCSSSEYVWLDLEGNDDLGNAVWTEKRQEEDILRLMSGFLRNHLEKYVIDAYDRLTREDMARVWEAQIDIKECPICEVNPLTRKIVKRSKQELRGWICAECKHHVILPSDILEFIGNNREFFSPG